MIIWPAALFFLSCVIWWMVTLQTASIVKPFICIHWFLPISLSGKWPCRTFHYTSFWLPGSWENVELQQWKWKHLQPSLDSHHNGKYIPKLKTKYIFLMLIWAQNGRNFYFFCSRNVLNNSIMKVVAGFLFNIILSLIVPLNSFLNYILPLFLM